MIRPLWLKLISNIYDYLQQGFNGQTYQVWWNIPVISALRWLRLDNYKLQSRLGYKARKGEGEGLTVAIFIKYLNISEDIQMAQFMFTNRTTKG